MATTATVTRQLAGELTVYTVGEYVSQIAGWTQGGGDIAVDLSEVTEIDTAGVQLLAFLRREAERTGTAVALAPVSDAVDEALATLGLEALLSPAPSAAVIQESAS